MRSKIPSKNHDFKDSNHNLIEYIFNIYLVYLDNFFCWNQYSIKYLIECSKHSYFDYENFVNNNHLHSNI